MDAPPAAAPPKKIRTKKKRGRGVVNFSPANIYGGLKAITNLAAPFTDMQFLPTGGVNTENIAEFTANPAIFAVGGSWVCKKGDITAGHFHKITELCKEARRQAGAQ